MKRYGNNLPSSHPEESKNQSGKVQYLPGNCAVRQDMVAFLMPADIPNNHKRPKPRNVFSIFKFGRKKTDEDVG